MAILSKALDEADMKKLTITETFDTEPFPFAVKKGSVSVLRVKDEKGSLLEFDYKVENGSKKRRFLSGPSWKHFLKNNGVEAGHTIAIDRNDAWCSEAAYKIEVIRT